jgi:hypothetical protein
MVEPEYGTWPELLTLRKTLLRHYPSEHQHPIIGLQSYILTLRAYSVSDNHEYMMFIIDVLPWELKDHKYLIS